MGTATSRAKGDRFTVGDNPMALFDRLHPGRLVAGYLVGLAALVVGLLLTPFSTFLLVLFWAWVGAFFLFAVGVLLLAYAFLGVSAWHYLRNGNVFPGRKLLSEPLARDSGSGLWDEWLDG